MAKIGATNGVKVFNEFHPGFFASTIERAPRLIRDVDSADFLSCIDFCHAEVITGGEPVRFIEALEGQTGLVHLADSDGITPMIHPPLGEGIVDLSSCLDAFQRLIFRDIGVCAYGCSMPERTIEISAYSVNFAGRLCTGGPIMPKPVRLRCAYLVNPIGVDALEPRLNWELESDCPDAREERQSAWQIAALRYGGSAVWHSGKMPSDQSAHIFFSGKPLVSRVRYAWKAKVWDTNGPASTWSDTATWTMGPRGPRYW